MNKYSACPKGGEKKMADLERLARRIDFLRNLADLEGAVQYEGENLTWEELADTLGVKRNSEGNIPGIELANACLRVGENPAVQLLPTEQRLRVIRSATDALGSLLGGESKK